MTQECKKNMYELIDVCVDKNFSETETYIIGAIASDNDSINLGKNSTERYKRAADIVKDCKTASEAVSKLMKIKDEGDA